MPLSFEEVSSGTVTVACKMPNGLILRLFRPIEKNELVMGGGSRVVHEYIETGERIELFGPAYNFGELPKGVILNGYALTPNVPAELWERWLEQNADTDLVRNKIVFAQSNRVDIEVETRDNEKRRSGLEQIDPQTPGRIQTFNPREM